LAALEPDVRVQGAVGLLPKPEAQAALEPDTPGAGRFAAQSCAEVVLFSAQSEPRNGPQSESGPRVARVSAPPVASPVDAAVRQPEPGLPAVLPEAQSRGEPALGERSIWALELREASAERQLDLSQLLLGPPVSMPPVEAEPQDAEQQQVKPGLAC